jgi:MFS transporter, BCD family, chlorophyll transporter
MSTRLFARPNQTDSDSRATRRSQSSDTLGALKVARLMLPKMGVAFLFVMLLSVFNRVMITELKIGATIVGIMYLGYNLMNVLQVSNGRLADRRAIFGLRRTPLMFIGLLFAALSLLPLPGFAYDFAAGNTLAFAGMLACMAGFGIGFAMNGDSHNTLIAELTEGKRNRPGVVSAVWLFQMVCIVASGIVTSIVLQAADNAAGAPKECVTAACSALRSQIAIDLMPKFFQAGPLVCLIGLLPLIGVERRLSRAEMQSVKARPALNIREAYARIFRNSQARIFFFFIISAIFGLFLQDDILEPFGADAFGMAVSETARFQSIMGSATILAMLVMGVVASRSSLTKRAIANLGALLAAMGFALLVASALMHMPPVFYVGIVTLGAGMGVFNIGALSMMMDMTVPGETGSLMGAWGMAQALANGAGQLVGGVLRDAGLALTGSAPIAYSVIFCVSIVMCFAAINLMAKVDIQKFKHMTREQMGLAIAEA